MNDGKEGKYTRHVTQTHYIRVRAPGGEGGGGELDCAGREKDHRKPKRGRITNGEREREGGYTHISFWKNEIIIDKHYI